MTSGWAWSVTFIESLTSLVVQLSHSQKKVLYWSVCLRESGIGMEEERHTGKRTRDRHRQSMGVVEKGRLG